MLLRSDETATVLGLVAAGVASAILPWLVVDPADPRISAARIDHLLPPRRIGLAWHRDRYHSTAFDDFVAVARDVCAELAEAAATADAHGAPQPPPPGVRTRTTSPAASARLDLRRRPPRR